MREADEERFNELLSWGSLHGAELHSALETYKDHVTGFSMRVKSDLKPNESVKPGDEILTCPLKISLSYLNATKGGPLLLANPLTEPERTESSPVFPPKFMQLQPHIIGRFYLMKQYLMGKSSFWYPYIGTLPQPDNMSSWSLPPFWPEEDAAFLQGTNAGVSAGEIRTNVKKEFKQARNILKEAGFENWQDYSRPLYNWAFSIFASRSFRPSLVIPKHVRDLELRRESDTDIDDFSILLPIFDIINHSMKAQVRWLVDHSSETAEICRFQTFDEYRPGDQIFNSYGRKTNSELLLSYGFTLPESDRFHNDYVHLRKKEAPPMAETVGAGEEPVLEGKWSERMDMRLHNNVVQPRREPRKAQDFVVSLRPMNDPTSFVGQARQWVGQDPDFDIKPGFAHVQDSLVWDLCTMIVGDENKDTFMDKILGKETQAKDAVSSSDRERECLRRILSVSETLPGDVSPVVAKVKEVLLAKLGMEYDKICETDPGIRVDEEGNEVVVQVEPKTRNQELAMQYRQQLQKVLENSIAALVPNWQGVVAGGRGG